MLNTPSNFVKVADLDELAEGKPRAVRVEGQSIALFKHNGNIYATDNQWSTHGLSTHPRACPWWCTHL